MTSAPLAARLREVAGAPFFPVTAFAPDIARVEAGVRHSAEGYSDEGHAASGGRA
ncbi:hypothetical protein [Streptomyces sp. S063]|uniref:hypothetical protein n=1 Tax=Streptomyces sp. S063 TaxID=2005885 RepID=UPI0013E3BFEE|nr:hypothetical protein [Streptomyces sp. S063]